MTDGDIGQRENRRNASNISTKAEWVHDVLPTARLRMVASVEGSRDSERLPWPQYANAGGKAIVASINQCGLGTSTSMILLPE